MHAFPEVPRRRWSLLLAAGACFAVLIPATTASAQIPQVCPDGTVVVGTACPLPPPVTAELRGLVAPTSTATYKCADVTRDTVYRLVRYIDPGNGWVRGVSASCKRADGSVYNLPVIGQTSSSGGATSCATGAPVGIYGRSGDVLDGVGVQCATDAWSSSTTLGLYQGDAGGSAKGPFRCPLGMALVGLEGGGAAYAGGFNVTRLKGWCAARTTLGAAGPVTASYRASSPQGPVRFRMLVSRAKADPASWNYGLYDLVIATGCSRTTHVPGGIVVSNRRKSGRRSRFSARPRGFRIKGSVSGSLSKPTVHATVKVLKSGCRGEVVEFTAHARR